MEYTYKELWNIDIPTLEGLLNYYRQNKLHKIKGSDIRQKYLDILFVYNTRIDQEYN